MSPPAPEAPRPTISFVIPVRNDAGRLLRCLETIGANVSEQHPVEVVVVDNGSSDDSAGVARRSGARVLVLPGLSVGELRNRGASLAQADVLAFVDADHEISPTWVPEVLGSLTDASVGAVGAFCHPPADGTWVQRAYDLMRSHAPGIHPVAWLGSGNLAVRRTAFEKVGGFDGRLIACEDVELCWRLRRAGYRILSNSALHNVHRGDPQRLRDLYRGELWRGRHNFRVSLRTLSSAREIPSLLIPAIDLLLLVATPILLFAGRPTWAAAAGGGVLALSALRAARMSRRMQRVTPLGVTRAFLVALVYDVARALALATRGQHRSALARAELGRTAPSQTP